MQRLIEKTGHEKTMRSLRFLLIRLKSRPETVGLCDEIEQTRRILQKKYEEWMQVEDERISATAEIEYRDAIVDSDVADIARQILLEVRGNRRNHRYLKLFPQSPSKLMRSIAGPEQTKFVLSLIDTLNTDPNYAGLKEHARLLAEHQKDLEVVIQKRTDWQVREIQLQSEWRMFYLQAQELYNSMYPRLLLLFPNNKNLVESCFIKQSRTTPKKET